MKRTAFRRKTPLTARQPMRRKSPRKREASPKPLSAGRAAQKGCSKRAERRFRSDVYLKWIRSMPCCKCLGPADDAHHVIGLGWGLSGMGMTAPDSYAMALCRECHQEVHADPYLQRFQPDWLIQTLTYGARQFPEGPIHDALIEALQFVISKQEVGA